MMEYRVRSKIASRELEAKKGKITTDDDYNVLVTRAARFTKPDGTLLGVYLPGVLADAMDEAYPILTTIRLHSDNRGLASGSVRVKAGSTRTRTKPVMSGILGAMDPVGGMKFCRQTAWTGKEVDQWQALRPLWKQIATHFKEQVPDRYKKQAEYCEHTAPDWVISETPFTTITINNTYPTGVHTDKGDLDKGFSCLAACRKGNWEGGILVWPEYRVGVNMRHGDLLLMDAHEWHGNTRIRCECDGGKELDRPCKECGAERISVVAYYRTEMYKCSTLDQENAKRLAHNEKRAALGEDVSDEAADLEALKAVTTAG